MEERIPGIELDYGLPVVAFLALHDQAWLNGVCGEDLKKCWEYFEKIRQGLQSRQQGLGGVNNGTAIRTQWHPSTYLHLDRLYRLDDGSPQRRAVMVPPSRPHEKEVQRYYESRGT